MGQKPHGILFGEELWHKFSLKVPTRGFRLKKGNKMGDFPANFFGCGAARIFIKKGSHVTRPPRETFHLWILIVKGRCGKIIILTGILVLFKWHDGKLM